MSPSLHPLHQAVLALLAVVPLAHAGEFDCVIEPRQLIELRSPVEGLIERVNVDRGDIVQKGQVLAQLDMGVDRVLAAMAQHRSQMEGAIRSGQSRADFTAAKSRRMTELSGRDYVSVQARDEAITEHRLAEAELRESLDNRQLAELDLARQQELIRLKTLRSPINGVVVERLLHPGEFAEAGVGRKPVFKLAQIDVLNVEVVLRSDAWGKVKVGSSVEVRPLTPPGGSHRATVKVVDRVLDAASGTFGVRLELPNPNHRIAAGVRCKVDFPDIASTAPGSARPERAAAMAR